MLLLLLIDNYPIWPFRSFEDLFQALMHIFKWTAPNLGQCFNIFPTLHFTFRKFFLYSQEVYLLVYNKIKKLEIILFFYMVRIYSFFNIVYLIQKLVLCSHLLLFFQVNLPFTACNFLTYGIITRYSWFSKDWLFFLI